MENSIDPSTTELQPLDKPYPPSPLSSCRVENTREKCKKNSLPRNHRTDDERSVRPRRRRVSAKAAAAVPLAKAHQAEREKSRLARKIGHPLYGRATLTASSGSLGAQGCRSRSSLRERRLQARLAFSTETSLTKRPIHLAVIAPRPATPAPLHHEAQEAICGGGGAHRLIRAFITGHACVSLRARVHEWGSGITG